MAFYKVAQTQLTFKFFKLEFWVLAHLHEFNIKKWVSQAIYLTFNGISLYTIDFVKLETVDGRVRVGKRGVVTRQSALPQQAWVHCGISLITQVGPARSTILSYPIPHHSHRARNLALDSWFTQFNTWNDETCFSFQLSTYQVFSMCWSF